MFRKQVLNMEAFQDKRMKDWFEVVRTHDKKIDERVLKEKTKKRIKN